MVAPSDTSSKRTLRGRSMRRRRRRRRSIRRGLRRRGGGRRLSWITQPLFQRGRGRRRGRSGCRSPPRDILFLPVFALGNLDIILRALCSGSLLFSALVLLGSTVDTVLVSVLRGFGFLPYFLRVGLEPEVVPDFLHSSTLPWHLAATGSVFALPGINRKNWIFCETTSAIISYEPLVFGSHFTVFGVAFAV